MHFGDQLFTTVEKLGPVCVGIDPDINKIPPHIINACREEFGESIEAIEQVLIEFGFGIIDAMEGIAGICKPQLAFFEQYGWHGIRAYEKICEYAQSQNILVISDGKRNDIGNTCEAYADAFLGETKFFENQTFSVRNDALTVNPYLGADGIVPFLERCKNNQKGIFILVKTSNESASQFQDLPVGEELLFEEIARNVAQWGMYDLGENHFSSVGAVVGALYPEDMQYLRGLMPNQFFLVPGYGAQGANAQMVASAFNEQGHGAIINSSRGINYAYLSSDQYTQENYIEAARAEILRMKTEIQSFL